MANNTYHIVPAPQSRRLKRLSSTNFTLKIALGLILLTIVPFALAYAETISVDVGDNSFDVEYTVSGMTVVDIESDVIFDVGYQSIILTVDVFDPTGTLVITFDRSFFDTVGGPDQPFFVLTDGDELPYRESFTLQSRTLTISVPLGAEEVEIVGSVPGNNSDLIPPPEPVADTGEKEKEPPIEGSQENPDAFSEPPPLKEEVSPEPVLLEDLPEAMEEKDDGDDNNDNGSSDQNLADSCGPGTVLKDGFCVLDETCGPGTILQDNTCIVDPTSKQSAATKTGTAKGLIFGAVAGFVIAGAVGVFFAIIHKASKAKN